MFITTRNLKPLFSFSFRIYLALIFSVSIFCLIFKTPNAWGVSATLATQKLDVDPTSGTTVTTFPINVPPGRAGIQPSVTLLYNSSSPNGPLGMGWIMELGTIERSTKKGVPAYTNADTFVLLQAGSSQELVDISGNGTEFRPKIEGGFSKILFNGTNWTMYDKKGTRYTFGSNNNSREADPNNSSHIFKWCLDMVTDTVGNTMTIDYTIDLNKVYPTDINYTSNASQGKSAFARVHFGWNWNARPDVLTNYQGGFKTTTNMRLREIQTYANSNLYSAYNLEYSLDPDTQQSLLTKITPLGSDGISSLPASLFTYSTANIGLKAPINLTSILNKGLVTYNTIRFLDMNKDGFIDIVDGMANSYQIYFNNGNNDFSPAAAALNTPDEGLNDPNVRMVDLNGDNLIDVVYGAGGAYRVWYNNGSNGFSPAKTLTNYPVTKIIDNQLLITDMNGDGKPDMVEPGVIYLNDGNNDFRPAIPAVNFPTKWINDPNVQVADFNGDGLLDVVMSSSTSPTKYTIWINNGQNGFNPPKQILNAPSASISSRLVYFVDMNGDGLTDILSAANGLVIYWNNGQGDFISGGVADGGASFSGSFTDNKMQLVDFNSDGFLDLLYGDSQGNNWRVWLNDGVNGFRSPVSLSNYPGSEGLDSWNVQLVDVNGDNRPDVLWGSSSFLPYKVYLNQVDSRSERPNVMVKIDNSMGATTELQYDHVKLLCLLGFQSRFAYNTLFFNTVKSITNKTAQGDSYSTNYQYKKCAFSYAQREFRGFGNVQVTDPNGNYTITNYLQDDIYKGRISDASAFDVNGNLYSKTVNTWASQTIYPGVTFPFLQRVDNYVYDGNSTGRRTAEEYSYGENPQYGNVTKVIQHGEVNLTDGSEVGTDTRTVETTYGNNTNTWLMGFPQTTFVRDNSGNIVRQTWFYYDGATSSTTLPANGFLTAKTEWGGSQTGAVNPSTYFSYDSLGNLKTTTDPRGNITTITYDPDYGLFPLATTNALNQTVSNEYYGINGVVLNSGDGFQGLWGQLKSTTDPNNQKGTTSYDLFGRPVFMVGPADSVNFPTTSIDYQINPTYSKVTTHSRKVSGQPDTIDSYDSYDGLGRVIQSKRPAETPGQYSVSGQTQYNSRGLPEKKYLPFFSTNSLDTIETIDTTRPFTTITYDAMGRAVDTLNPDNTHASVSYDDWTTTTIDENGHKQMSYFDAYGRLIKKEEYSGADGRSTNYPSSAFTLYATTQYNYDSEGNLLKTIDAKNNTTTITYDTLGRKTQMVDPDMGTWVYTYDASGNLATQKDAKLKTITFTYDALNRLTNKTDGTSNLNVNYTYDSTATSYSKGRITQASYTNGNTTFSYDPLGREIKSTKTIDSNSYSVERTYDALSRLTSLKYPDNTVLYYNYNATGQIESVNNIDPNGGSGQVSWDVTYGASNGLPDSSWTKNTAGTTDIFAHWRLNDNTSSTSVNDTGSGASVIQASTSTSSFSQAGKINAAFNFNGTSQYVNLDDFLSKVRTDSTGSFSLWIKPTTGGGTIFNFGGPGGYIQFEYLSGNQNVALTISGNGTAFKCSTPPSSVAPSVWSHIVVVQDGVSPKIYVNNVLQTLTFQVSNVNGAWFTYNWAGPITYGRLAAFNISTDPNNNNSFYSGMVDDMRYYKRVLGSTEIAGLYNSGSGSESQPSTAYVENDSSTSSGQRLVLDTSTASGYTLWYAQTAAGTKWFDTVNPATGYTIEKKIKVLSSGSSGAVDLKVSDGSKQFILRFFDTQIQVPSGYLAEGVKTYAMATTDAYHCYRVTVQGTLLKVYVDNTLRLSGTLNSASTAKSLEWGDMSTTVNYGGLIAFDQVKYTTQGAYAPTVTSSPVTYVTNVDYNAAGQMVKVQLGNGDISTYTYDSKTLRLTNLTTTSVSATLQNLSYTYDSVGNILTITDGVNTASQTFQYDALNRLTQAVGSYGTKTFAYDQLGNLLTKDGLTYTYPAAGFARPHAVSSLSDGTSFTYDANGNMATRAKAGVTTYYTFDTENRLCQVKNGTTVQATFAYDGDGGRVKKIAGTTTTRYVGNLYEDTATATVKHIYLGSTEVASVNGSLTMYYHQDHLGGTNVTTDANGVKKEIAEYLPFGGFSRHDKYGSSSEVAWFYFTGKKLDDETGLYFYGARYYDPSLARFITADTIVQAASNPQTLNRYTYCNNNPVNLIDPTGHFWGFIFAVVRAIIAAAIEHPYVFAAAVNATVNVAANAFAGNIHNYWDVAKYSTIGAASGVVGVGVGLGVGGLAGPALGEFWGGLIGSAAGGLAGGMTQGSATAAFDGAPFGEIIIDGVRTGLYSAATAAGTYTVFYAGSKIIETIKAANAAKSVNGNKTSIGTQENHETKLNIDEGSKASVQQALRNNEVRFQGTRELTNADLGIKGKIQDLKGTFTMKGNQAIVRVDMLRAEPGSISNAREIVPNLIRTARQYGATSLRVEAIYANEKLMHFVDAQYSLKTDGSIDFFTIDKLDMPRGK